MYRFRNDADFHRLHLLYFHQVHSFNFGRKPLLGAIYKPHSHNVGESNLAQLLVDSGFRPRRSIGMDLRALKDLVRYNL